MQRIEASNDSALDPFRDMPDRRRRADGGRFVVESPRCVSRFLDAVASGRFTIDSVVADPSHAELLDTAADLGATVFSADDAIITEASGYHFHAGCLALGIRPPQPEEPDGLAEQVLRAPAPRIVLLALAGVTSMDNIGGVFRSVAALGAHGLVLDHACADPLLRRCIRISMGQVFRVAWAVSPSLPEGLARLRQTYGFKIIGMENLPDASPLSALTGDRTAELEADLIPERVVVVVGNEGHGLAPEVLEACDSIRRIEGPPSLPDGEGPGEADERSLNASTAASIAIHHVLHA